GLLKNFGCTGETSLISHIQHISHISQQILLKFLFMCEGDVNKRKYRLTWPGGGKFSHLLLEVNKHGG
ncbi:MAG: hypothetical protein ACK56I_35120, partial [bacterium]